ncbi:hypothetical protein NHX12_013536, partial [Muraenolepis orangiensis]
FTDISEPQQGEAVWSLQPAAGRPILASSDGTYLVTPGQSEQQHPIPANEVPPFPEPSRPPGSPPQSPPPPLHVNSPVYPSEPPPPPAGPLLTPPCGGLKVPENTVASGAISPPHRRKETDSTPATTHNVGRESVAEKTPQCREPAKRPPPPFPLWFSQMDCDSHLAQCLSEMNVDIAW